MHYAVNKETNLVKYSADNLYLLQHVFDLYKDDIENNIPTEYDIKFHNQGMPIYMIDVFK